MANVSLILDWLYENELRAYPLREAITRLSDNTYSLQDGVIADAQLIYTSATSTASLSSIVVSDSTITFHVSGGLTFVATVGQPFPQYLRLETGSLLVIGKFAANIPIGTYNFSNVYFEQSVIYEFYGPWLGVSSIAFLPNDPITGAIDLFEGYQFGVSIQGQNLFLGANNIYGLPIDCTHFGDSENDCDSIVSFINGISPDGNNELKIIGGPGINVYDDPDNHRIYVGFAFTSATDICAPILPYPT